MKWSHYSEKLFDTFVNTDDNIIVQACPGSGKTTNIAHLWTLDDKPTVYLVFNKHNQLEAEAKLPVKQGSNVLTLNGLGHRAVTANFGRVTLDDRKVQGIVKKYIRMNCPYREKREREWSLIKAISMAKMSDLDGTMSADMLDDMCSTYDLESYDGMYDDVMRCLSISDDITSVIDFNDQIRFPVIHNLSMPQYHNVLGDEVQDFSIIQAHMVARLQAQRYGFVGDKHQSIYGFRGAMNGSMDYLKESFNCVELPLSISYRCASNIVREAYDIFPDIEVWEESPYGTVKRGLWQEDDTREAFHGDLIVLCRTNRPLIALAFDLLRQDIPCHVRGRDIGQGLVKLIEHQESTSVRQLIDRLAQWRELETQKAIAKDDDMKQQRITDKYESVMLFISKCNLADSPVKVTDHINMLFEQGRGICLSTVHKAKGLEAEKCFIVEPGLHSFFETRARQSWQKEQERNIKYVAVTRGKRELVYL